MSIEGSQNAVWMDWQYFRALALSASGDKWWPQMARVSSMPAWQGVAIITIVTWLIVAKSLMLTQRLRGLLQDPVTKHVQNSVGVLLFIQVSTIACTGRV